MSVINFGQSVSLKEFAHAVATVGQDVTIIGQGEPGIGKSSMLKVLGDLMPGYEVAYIDCTLLLPEDFALPYMDQVEATDNTVVSIPRVTRFSPNARFKLHSSKPVILMLDEIGKAMKQVKNALLTLMMEGRIGEFFLPVGPNGEKSIVFGTTNLQSEGVGDLLEAHARNRVTMVQVRKPHAGFNADGSIDEDSWGRWAINNGIDAAIIAWVKQYPQALASYTDPSQKENPYIFDPKRAGGNAFVTPRSLEKASHIAKRRDMLGDSLTISLLTGAIGESAARDMQAFFTVVDKLPSWEAIIGSPKTAKMPDDTVAKCILVFSALTRVEKDTLAAWMDYVERMDKEWQALFATSLMKSPTKQAFAVHSKKFVDWARTNQWMF